MTKSTGKEKKLNGLQHLIASAKPFKGKYLLSIFMAVLGVTCRVLPFIIISQVILSLYEGIRTPATYAADLLLMAVSYLLESFFSGISVNLAHRACYQTLAEIRISALNKMFTLPLGYVKSQSIGELKNMVVDRIESLEPTLAHLIPEMTANLIVPVFVLSYMFLLDWRMAFLALAILPLGCIFILFSFRDYDKNFQTQISLSKKVNSSLIEYINGLEVIKIFNHGSRSFQKFSDTVEENANFSVNWMYQISFWVSAAQVVWFASLVFVLPMGLVFVQNGSLEAGRFLQLIILTLSWIKPILAASQFTDQISTVRTTTKEIFDMLNDQDLIRPEKGISPSDHSIELKKVHFAYGQLAGSQSGGIGKEALHGISFCVPEGKKIALVGPSGGGKTTIGRLIAGFWDAGQGSVEIGGRNLKELSVDEIGKCIAYVDQDVFLFHAAIRENLCLGNSSITEEQMIAAAKAACCHDFIMALPQGYDTVAGRRGSHLSGGERQRISLARALLKDAPIIILDEATAYFDPDSEVLIEKALSELTKGKTLVVIAHRLSTVTDADQIVVIENGTIAAQGTHKELLNASKLYCEMWNAHAGAKEYDREELR